MQHKGVIRLKPSSFQLINKPRVTKNMFQVNKVLNVKLNNANILTLFKAIYPSILQSSQ